MANYTAPTRGSEAFNCPRCGALAQQQWGDMWLYSDAGDPVEAHDEPQYRSMLYAEASFTTDPTGWAMSSCFACKRGSVWRGMSLVFPLGNVYPEAHVDLPAGAAQIYEEARAVGAVSRRAGTALARAALEQLLKDLRPQDSGQLDDRIAALNGQVSFALWQMLTVLRHAGNKVLHGGDEGDVLVAYVLQDDDGGMLGLLLNTVNDLVEELVTRPAQASKYFDQLPEGVAKTALKKAGLPEVAPRRPPTGRLSSGDVDGEGTTSMIV